MLVGQVARVHWGLIPSWAQDPSIGNRMINARADAAPEKQAFRTAFTSRRCFIPASGFYEWRATGGKGKQPYYMHAKDGATRVRGAVGTLAAERNEAPVESCTILTTDANATMAPIHDRMPVILGWLTMRRGSARSPRPRTSGSPTYVPAELDHRLIAEPVGS